MTEYFLPVSFYHSDIILVFQTPNPEEIAGFFSISAPLWFQLIYHNREEGKAKTMFAPEK